MEYSSVGQDCIKAIAEFCFENICNDIALNISKFVNEKYPEYSKQVTTDVNWADMMWCNLQIYNEDELISTDTICQFSRADCGIYFANREFYLQHILGVVEKLIEHHLTPPSVEEN